MPRPSISRWYLEPALPRSTGFAPVSSPHAWPHAHAVDRRPGPVDLAVVTQPGQQPMVQLLPDPGGLPGPQPPPAGDPAAAAQRPGRQQPPGRAGAQDIDQATKDGPIRDPRAAAVWLGWVGWQQRRDRVPDVVRDQLLGHGRRRGRGLHRPSLSPSPAPYETAPLDVGSLPLTGSSRSKRTQPSRPAGGCAAELLVDPPGGEPLCRCLQTQRLRLLPGHRLGAITLALDHHAGLRPVSAPLRGGVSLGGA